ncbi:DNA-processing protein DprA [Bifidobacterium crudilactis]|uniref:DNA-processing protein DprA n=1 Tax=Bifidobacterium crudilactis TaxID=327277 RepID=UPI00068B5C59|nr:DNA-processing protein DprA [Bifidobacterium crudilactis]
MNDDPREGNTAREATDAKEHPHQASQHDSPCSTSTIAVTMTSTAATTADTTVSESAKPALQQHDHAIPDMEDTLARALLSYCADGPDPIMHNLVLASMKGKMEGPAAILDCLRREYSCKTPGTGRYAQRLQHAFMEYLTEVEPSHIDTGRRSFTTRMDRWLVRYAQIPDLRDEDLHAWITAGGKYWILTPEHPHWPKLLNDLHLRAYVPVPLCLWGQGQSSTLALCQQPVAIVGSRELDDYGRQVTQAIACAVGNAGHVVISGGAIGADACAHHAAISCRSGTSRKRRPDDADSSGMTVAVFAGGLDHMGPARNLELFEAILSSGGTLLSELSPDTIPAAPRFLFRNRIIAALAGSVVVTQARVRSGALNTAHWADMLCREVYAVPGMITTPNNAGCNALIRDHKAESILKPEEVANLVPHRHEPMRRSSKKRAGTTSLPIGGLFPQQATSTPVADNHTGNGSETGSTDTTFTPLQHSLLSIIRTASSNRPLRVETLLTMFNRRHTEGNLYGNTSSPPQTPPTIEQVLTALGTLEIAGFIAYDNRGLLKTVTPGNRQSP